MLSKKLLSSFFIFLLCFCSSFVLQAQDYNTWRYHNSYETSTALEVSDQAVWSASLTGLMRFDRSSGELETFDKTNGLSDVLIREMAWNSEVNVLIVGYGNSNIDLIDDFGNVINLPDVLNSSLTGSKLINDIYTQGTNAYLSSDFGIIVLDLINLA